MIHIIDDYFLLAGSIIAIIWGVASLFLTPYLMGRAGEMTRLVLPVWISRSVLVLVTGLVILAAITNLGTENETVRSITLLSGMAFIALVLLTGPRVYRVIPAVGKFGVPLELLAGILILIGSFI
ncbi:hypothetical protein ABFB09_03320 [Dehalogenimonas sp. THU2]|uniref:hypothetical protein n=1 Tax=Dehalogenimonas sp. THU2 TaxID=3151121 RepID=UPI0032182A4A